MNLLNNLEQTSVILNRYLVRQLEARDLTFHEYQCRFAQPPQQGDEQRAISSVCYKLGTIAVRLGSRIITKEEISRSNMRSNDWELVKTGTRKLDCGDAYERKALETFERKVLEKGLKNSFQRTGIERALEGGLIWWIIAQGGIEECGNGWEVHRGRRIDVAIDSDGKLYLEIDTHHRFYTPWTLHQWLEEYPDISISYVRSTYKNNGKYDVWQYEKVSDQSPQQVILEGLNISLADYHRRIGATEEEISDSRVVLVKRLNDRKAKSIPHLSQRLSPSLTMEMLANIAEEGTESQKVREVFRIIRKSLNFRMKESREAAEIILEKVYGISRQAEPIRVDGYILPRAKLLAFNNQQVDKVAEVRYKGCARVGEIKFGCLNLYDESHQYPEEVRKCLLEIAERSNTEIAIDSYRTGQDLPESELDQKIFWQNWSNEGIKTVLVIMPWSPNDRKQKIRVQALQAGISTQFIVPTPKKEDRYKALNVVLGLLCKAGWQVVRLEPLNHPECADLIIGFDTGTNRELYYGTSAFAVLADGQSLGWELPDVQRGEAFSGKAIWQTVSKLVLKFYQSCGRYPKKLLLMRDGLVQEGEFELTIEELAKKNIAVDVVGVRKSGAGRMGKEITRHNGKVYRDARMGTVVFVPKEKSFTLVTSQPISENIGSARPLRVVHEYGKTPLEIIALQTYHLSQLHPASGFQSCRLPWVLHLADRSSKEFQRIGQISILQNISREKLIAV